MKIKKLLLAVIAAMSLSVSHATEGNLEINMKNQASNWISLVSTDNLYFNFSSYTGQGHDLKPGECFAFKVVSQSGNVVYLKHISVIPANTPIWIWGNPGNEEGVISIITFDKISDLDKNYYGNDFDNVDGNLLVGSATEQTETIAGDYVLSKKDNDVHAVTGSLIGQMLPKGKCLLRLGTSSNTRLSIGMLDDEVAGIDALTAPGGELVMYDPSKPSFDAQGRRIDPQQKGLHIQNGYKFYIK